MGFEFLDIVIKTATATVVIAASPLEVAFVAGAAGAAAVAAIVVAAKEANKEDK